MAFRPRPSHLGKPLAYMITESGEMNTIVHIWVYEDAADRAKRRAAMTADPGLAGLSEEKRGSGLIWKTRPPS